MEVHGRWNKRVKKKKSNVLNVYNYEQFRRDYHLLILKINTWSNDVL